MDNTEKMIISACFMACICPVSKHQLHKLTSFLCLHLCPGLDSANLDYTNSRAGFLTPLLSLIKDSFHCRCYFHSRHVHYRIRFFLHVMA